MLYVRLRELSPPPHVPSLVTEVLMAFWERHTVSSATRFGQGWLCRRLEEFGMVSVVQKAWAVVDLFSRIALDLGAYFSWVSEVLMFLEMREWSS